MVLLHVKACTDLQFLVECKASEQIAEVLQTVVNIHNCSAQIHIWKDMWSSFRSTDHAEGFQQDSLQETARKIHAAEELLSKDNIGKKLALSEAALKDALQDIKSSLPGDLSERLPAEHALQCLTAGNAIPADLPSGKGGKYTTLDAESAVLWFAYKRMLPEKKLRDYLGRNEKTKAIVQLQKSDDGMPVRSRDEDAEKVMLAYYFKKQEEHKAMERANEGMHAEHSAWANPGALKGQLQAVPGIQLPTM